MQTKSHSRFKSWIAKIDMPTLYLGTLPAHCKNKWIDNITNNRAMYIWLAWQATVIKSTFAGWSILFTNHMDLRTQNLLSLLTYILWMRCGLKGLRALNAWLLNQLIFGWCMIFPLHQSYLTHSSIIKLILNIKPTWISTHRHTSCAIWRWLKCVKIVKVGSGHVFVVLGVHTRVLTLINDCHYNHAHFAWTSKMFILIKKLFLNYFYYIVDVKMAFVLTLTIQFNVWTLSSSYKSFAYMWLEI